MISAYFCGWFTVIHQKTLPFSMVVCHRPHLRLEYFTQMSYYPNLIQVLNIVVLFSFCIVKK